ncbi:cytochrome bd-I oxidase subunit CydX [Enterobacteriaceae endosymbiont of Plateumaris sericea]
MAMNMWYFTWFIGVLLACFFSIIIALTIEYKEK